MPDFALSFKTFNSVSSDEKILQTQISIKPSSDLFVLSYYFKFLMVGLSQSRF